MNTEHKKYLSKRRHWRVRTKVIGSDSRPRMSVKFSNQHIYVQFIDDSVGRTILSVGTRNKLTTDSKIGANIANAIIVGKKAGEIALTAGLTEVVFDRGAAKYHGKVKALADAARQAGLKF